MNIPTTPTTPTTSAPKIVTVADTHLIFEYSISAWTATKRDKKVTDEVTRSKNAKAGATSVNKHLFANEPMLNAIKTKENLIRKHFTDNLTPFGRGAYFVPSVRMMDMKRNVLDRFEKEFYSLVDAFVDAYPQLVGSAALNDKMGDMFNIEDYPKPSRIREKFSFTYAFFPVPMNDFRVAPSVEAAAEMEKYYKAETDRRLEAAMRDAWGKLHDCLVWASNTLTDRDDGGHKRIFDSSVEKFMGLTTLLSDFNLTGDHKLEAKRQQLESLFSGRTASALAVELRESPSARSDMKSKVDSMLSSLDFDL